MFETVLPETVFGPFPSCQTDDHQVLGAVKNLTEILSGSMLMINRINKDTKENMVKAFYTWWPPTTESSFTVEDAVENLNRGLYRVLVARLSYKGFRHSSTTIARLSPSGLERGG